MFFSDNDFFDSAVPNGDESDAFCVKTDAVSMNSTSASYFLEATKSIPEMDFSDESDPDLFIIDDNVDSDYNLDIEDDPLADKTALDTTTLRQKIISSIEQLALKTLEQLEDDMLEIKLINLRRSQTHATSVRTLSWPKRGKNGGMLSLARLFRVVNLVHEALVTNVPTMKRDIYYKDVTLFKTQSVVDQLIDSLAATLNVPRSMLNVRASSKGLVCGTAIRIYLKDGGVVQGSDTEGALIPISDDISMLQISDNLSWVLVIEKEAVFHTLCKIGLTTHPLCPGIGILITGKGYPDLATRGLVGQLSTLLPEKVPLLALVDADAYGLDILSVYKYGSRATQHEGNAILARRLQWLGLRASDLSRLDIDREFLIPLTKHDYNKALQMLRRNSHILPDDWRFETFLCLFCRSIDVQARKELCFMLHTRRKAEIEILATLKTSGLKDEPALLKYIIDRLSHLMNTSNE